MNLRNSAFLAIAAAFAIYNAACACGPDCTTNPNATGCTNNTTSTTSTSLPTCVVFDPTITPSGNLALTGGVLTLTFTVNMDTTSGNITFTGTGIAAPITASWTNATTATITYPALPLGGSYNITVPALNVASGNATCTGGTYAGKTFSRTSTPKCPMTDITYTPANISSVSGTGSIAVNFGGSMNTTSGSIQLLDSSLVQPVGTTIVWTGTNPVTINYSNLTPGGIYTIKYTKVFKADATCAFDGSAAVTVKACEPDPTAYAKEANDTLNGTAATADNVTTISSANATYTISGCLDPAYNTTFTIGTTSVTATDSDNYFVPYTDTTNPLRFYMVSGTTKVGSNTAIQGQISGGGQSDSFFNNGGAGFTLGGKTSFPATLICQSGTAYTINAFFNTGWSSVGHTLSTPTQYTVTLTDVSSSVDTTCAAPTQTVTDNDVAASPGTNDLILVSSTFTFSKVGGMTAQPLSATGAAGTYKISGTINDATGACNQNTDIYWETDVYSFTTTQAAALSMYTVTNTGDMNEQDVLLLKDNGAAAPTYLAGAWGANGDKLAFLECNLPAGSYYIFYGTWSTDGTGACITQPSPQAYSICLTFSATKC